MATVYRNANGVFYVNYVQAGRRTRTSLGTRDEVLARLARGDLETRLARGELGLARPDIGVEDFEGRYLGFCRDQKAPGTAKGDQRTLARFFGHVRKGHLGAITSGDVASYQGLRLSEVDRSTVDRELQTVRAAFRWAVRMGLLAEDPTRGVPRLRQERHLVESLGPEALERLLAALREPIPCHGRGGKGRGGTRARRMPLFAMAATAAFAGLRLGEILHLGWEDVDLARQRLRVAFRSDFRPKDREEREVPLCGRLAAILEVHGREWPGPGARVFASSSGGALDRRNAHRELVRVGERLGLRCHWQILRHTFACHLVAAGVSIFLVSRLLGHSSVTTTERFYAHLAPAEHRSELDRVFGRLGGVASA